MTKWICVFILGFSCAFIEPTKCSAATGEPDEVFMGEEGDFVVIVLGETKKFDLKSLDGQKAALKFLTDGLIRESAAQEDPLLSKVIATAIIKRHLQYAATILRSDIKTDSEFATLLKAYLAMIGTAAQFFQWRSEENIRPLRAVPSP